MMHWLWRDDPAEPAITILFPAEGGGHVKWSITRVAILVVLTASVGACDSGQSGSLRPGVAQKDDLLNLDAVRQLLRVMDTIMAQNRDYEATISRLRRLDEKAQRDSVAVLVRRNAEDPAVKREIGALLSTRAYELYFAQFRSADSSVHRRILQALPYYAEQGPADVSENLLELCRHRQAVASWVDSIVSRIDLGRCQRLALEWLPTGQYALPKTYFIYDGNGDAFAREGEVCFDLFSLMLRARPSGSRFENLAAVGTDEMENVLAHEFHHVHAGRYLYPPGRSYASWQERWRDRIVRRIISEGMAMQCNPPQGFARELKEDSGIIGYWIDQLNQKLAVLDNGSITESELQEWYGRTYQDTAVVALKEYLMRRFPHGDPDTLVTSHISERPDFEHTLGWWMISRISDEGKRKDKAIPLLSHPEMLFTQYNAAIGDKKARLRVTDPNR
jgi:hypothetical protein